MPMIRQSDRDVIARDAIALHLGDLMERGRSLREEAKRRGQAILDKAHAERQRILEGAQEKGFEAGRAEGLSAGYRDGFEKGHAEAVAEAKQRTVTLATALEQELALFVRQRQELVDSAGADVLGLVLKIAERVIKRKIEAEPEVVIGQLEHVLAMVARPTRLVVRIHPEDRVLLAELMPGIVNRFTMVKHLEMVEDGTLSRGSIVAMDGGGEGGTHFDAEVDSQLDRIAAAIVPKSDTNAGNTMGAL